MKGLIRSRNREEDRIPTLLVSETVGLLSPSTTSYTRTSRCHMTGDAKSRAIVVLASCLLLAMRTS
jgi:hypothetical protein